MEPKRTLYGILAQKVQYNEFWRVWVKELGLDELNGSLHGIKEHPDKNKSYYDGMTSCPRRLRILFMNTVHYIREALMRGGTRKRGENTVACKKTLIIQISNSFNPFHKNNEIILNFIFLNYSFLVQPIP